MNGRVIGLNLGTGLSLGTLSGQSLIGKATLGVKSGLKVGLKILLLKVNGLGQLMQRLKALKDHLLPLRLLHLPRLPLLFHLNQFNLLKVDLNPNELEQFYDLSLHSQLFLRWSRQSKKFLAFLIETSLTW